MHGWGSLHRQQGLNPLGLPEQRTESPRMKPPQEGVAAHPPQNLYSSPVGVSLSPLSTLDLKGALGQEADRRLEEADRRASKRDTYTQRQEERGKETNQRREAVG